MDNLNHGGNPVALEHQVFPALSGRSKRKLERAQTVHLKAICPQCGAPNMKFRKVLFIKGTAIQHKKWYCKNCGKTATRGELKHVKYA